MNFTAVGAFKRLRVAFSLGQRTARGHLISDQDVSVQFYTEQNYIISSTYSLFLNVAYNRVDRNDRLQALKLIYSQY